MVTAYMATTRASGNRRGLESEVQAIPEYGQKGSDGQFKTEYELKSESSGGDAVPCVRKWDSIPMEGNRGFDAMKSTNYHPRSDVLKL